MLLSSVRWNDGAADTGRGEFVEADAEVCLALGFETVVEDAHGRLVVCAAGNLRSGLGVQPAIGGSAVPQALEARPHAPFRLALCAVGFHGGDGGVGLAVVAPRRAREIRNVAEAHVAELASRHAAAAVEKAVLGQLHRVYA